MDKNKGLKKIISLGRSEAVEDPSEIAIFVFAPCSSVEIESLFL